MDSEDIKEISDRIDGMARNMQYYHGRRHAIKRLKSHGVTKIDGKELKKMKKVDLCRAYKKYFGECDTFKELTTRKKDALCYLYYESIKQEFMDSEADGVYIIGNVNQGVCKIGYSKKPYKRLKMIQTGCPYPVYVLRYYSGIGRKEEHLLHRKYQRYKIHGEWFEIKGGIRKALKQIIINQKPYERN